MCLVMTSQQATCLRKLLLQEVNCFTHLWCSNRGKWEWGYRIYISIYIQVYIQVSDTSACGKVNCFTHLWCSNMGEMGMGITYLHIHIHLSLHSSFRHICMWIYPLAKSTALHICGVAIGRKWEWGNHIYLSIYILVYIQVLDMSACGPSLWQSQLLYTSVVYQ